MKKKSIKQIENEKIEIIKAYGKLLRTLDKKFRTNDGYIEYIGIRLMCDLLRQHLGEKALKYVIKEVMANK